MHRVVEDIRDKINRGEYKEGQKLPPQDKFARNLGISRGTLREALHQLMLMGLIEMRQGDGTYIRRANPSIFINSLSPALLMDKSYANELLAARLFIEAEMASLAAKNATRKETNELKLLLNGMKQDMISGEINNFINKDVEFHLLIANCSKNRVLVKVVQTIRDTLYQFIADFFAVMPFSIEDAMSYHTKIFRAIEKHDQVAAKKHMESHIRSLMQRISKSEANKKDSRDTYNNRKEQFA